MAYEGYLIKVGDYKIPHSWIKADAYSVVLSNQDLDSYRDCDGKLHRTALKHKIAKVEFETPSQKTDKEMSEFLENIWNNRINETEDNVLVTAYIPKYNNYQTQEMYVPDIPFSIYYADDKEIKYNSIRMAFIEY